MSIGQVTESAALYALIRERDAAIEALERANLRGVTVVIPCCDQVEYLSDSLGSVWHQTVLPLEVIIVDDGSKVPVRIAWWDDQQTTPTRIVRVANRGLPSARNVGLMHARGHAFLPLDADDWLEPTHIEKTLPLLDHADVVCVGLQEHGERKGTYKPGCEIPLRELTLEKERASNRLFYCNPSDAPVWMGDYTFRSLGEISPGDKVIGWSRPGVQNGRTKRPVLTRATVLATEARARVPIVRVMMESGREIRCTKDHRWLVYQQRRREYGDIAGNGFNTPLVGSGRDGYAVPEPNRIFSHVIEPVTTGDRSGRHSGYLAGLYDGEGSGRAISQSESHNPDVCASIRTTLEVMDIPFTETKFEDKCRVFWIGGGRQGYVEFVNKVGPARIRSWDSQILTSKFRTADRVISVTPDGTSDVVSMETSTGNYVAWGYASKNCALFRTDLLRACGGYNGRMINGYEDWDLWIDLMQRGARFASVDEPLFHYRTSPDGMLARTEASWREWNLDEMARHHGYERPKAPAVQTPTVAPSRPPRPQRSRSVRRCPECGVITGRRHRRGCPQEGSA